MNSRTMSIRVGVSVFGLILLSAIPARSQVNSAPEFFGDPMATLSPDQLSDFFAGQDEFKKVFTPETGLGPIFNDTSCAACHAEGATGGGSAVTVTRFGRLTNGRFDPLTELGGSLLQRGAIDPSMQEVIPPEANIVAQRRSTALFGLGLIEAIPDADIVSNTRVSKAMGVVGRAALIVDAVTGEKRIGRFGWKAQHATLLAFAGDASVNELGITNRLFPDENLPNGEALPGNASGIDDVVDEATGKAGVDRLADFMRYLAAPHPREFTPAAESGLAWFARSGRAECHVTVMFTGQSSIPALDRKPVFLYSELLLHDMGPLGDGIAQGAAGPREIRTSPLWGLSMQSSFLHDGRAATIKDAILMHDGEAAPSRDAFIYFLTGTQQLQVLEFLNSI